MNKTKMENKTFLLDTTKSKRFFSGVIMLFFSFITITFAQTDKYNIKEKNLGRIYTTVVSIPIGDDIKYENDGIGEIERTGPSSFKILNDGSFIIVDTPTGRIIRYDRNGQKVNEIKVEDAVGITDVAVADGQIFALDTSSVQPVVFRILELTGKVIEKIDIPAQFREDGLTGIKVGKNGQIFFEMKDGAEFVDIYNNRVAKNVTPLAEFQTSYFTSKSDVATNFADMRIEERQLPPVRVKNDLAALKPLAVLKNGTVLISAVEMVSTPTIYVDQTIRRYDSKGRLTGIARVPLFESYVYIQNNVSVSDDGDVYVLTARPKSLDVVKLNFEKNLDSILPDKSQINSETPTAVSAACSISRDQIARNADAFVNNSVSLRASNITGTCSGRGKPRYLGNAGTYSSVSYKWGGSISVSSYNSAMSNGSLSGDIDTTNPTSSYGVDSCDFGVDCSGFVSQTWQIPYHTTRSLPDVSDVISSSSLKTGDIINDPGNHVVLFNSTATNGYNVWESTIYQGVDRVMKWFTPATRLNGYTPRRYKNICDTVTPARPVVTTSLKLNTSSPYYTGKSINVSYTITNLGGQAITLSQVGVGGRLNNDNSCSGGCPDFPFASNVTLVPNASYTFNQSQTFSRSGNYNFFAAYKKQDGTWVTNIDTTSGTSNSLGVYISPIEIEALSPNSIRKGTGIWIKATGGGFKAGIRAWVNQWEIATSGINRRSDAETLVYVVMNNTGTFTLKLQNPDGSSATKTFSVTN